MDDTTWYMIGLFVGVGLIFITDFKTRRDHLIKALGVVMVMRSTYCLTGLLWL